MSKLATEAELRALRAQINPYFLFNALTTIGYGIGIPKDSVLKYETHIRAGKFVVIAHGTQDELAKSKTILRGADYHDGTQGNCCG